MIIIFEGPNKAGKSTIISRLMLEEPERFIVLDFGYPREKNPEAARAYAKAEYYTATRFFEFIEKFGKRDIICNRFHLGEIVYGKVKRNYKVDYIRSLEISMRQKYDVRLVLVTADSDTIEARLRSSHEEEYITVREVKSVVSLFEQAYRQSILKRMRINTGKLSEDEAFQLAKKFIF